MILYRYSIYYTISNVVVRSSIGIRIYTYGTATLLLFWSTSCCAEESASSMVDFPDATFESNSSRCESSSILKSAGLIAVLVLRSKVLMPLLPSASFVCSINSSTSAADPDMYAFATCKAKQSQKQNNTNRQVRNAQGEKFGWADIDQKKNGFSQVFSSPWLRAQWLVPWIVCLTAIQIRAIPRSKKFTAAIQRLKIK